LPATSANGLKRHKGLEPLMGAIGPPCPFFALIVLIDSNHVKKHEIDDGTAAPIRRIERARRRPDRVQLGARWGIRASERKVALTKGPGALARHARFDRRRECRDRARIMGKQVIMSIDENQWVLRVLSSGKRQQWLQLKNRGVAPILTHNWKLALTFASEAEARAAAKSASLPQRAPRSVPKIGRPHQSGAPILTNRTLENKACEYRGCSKKVNPAIQAAGRKR
jgi:hypothetical protein